MQESRLFKIVYYLLEHEKSTAPELAEKFEVSVRTIYRDIDALSSAGIPICATQGKGGGIYLLDNFVLDRSMFSDDEKEILSDEFAEKYEGKVLEFIDFISDRSVAVEGTYKETWKYIEKDKNSLQRHSNMHLIFNKV